MKPKKFFSNIIELIKKRYLDFIAKQKERNQARAELKAQVQEAVREEKKSQRINTAIFKEQLKGEKAREYIKQGGALGRLSKGFSNLAKAIPKQSPIQNQPIQKVQPFQTIQHDRVGRKRKKYSAPSNTTSPSLGGGLNPNILEDLANFKLKY